MDNDDLEKLFKRVIAQSPYSADDTPGERVLADYLTGQLSVEDVKELKRYLESDPELRDSLKNAEEALQWFRDNQKKSRLELESMLLQTKLAATVKVDWTALVGKVEAETVRIIRSLVDAINSATPSQPLPQPAAAFRRSVAEELKAEVAGDDTGPRTAGFAVVRAQIESDGRCSVALSTTDETLWRTDEAAYRCSLRLQIGDVQLRFQDATIDRQGYADFIVNLPVETEPLKLAAQWLHLQVQRK